MPFDICGGITLFRRSANPRKMMTARETTEQMISGHMKMPPWRKKCRIEIELSARRLIVRIVYVEIEGDFQLPIPEHRRKVIRDGWKIAFHDGSCRDFGKVVREWFCTTGRPTTFPLGLSRNLISTSPTSVGCCCT